MRDNRRQRRRRLVRPYRIERVVALRRQNAARLLRRRAQSLHRFLRMQPGIVTELVAGSESVGNPLSRRLVDQVPGRDRGDVHFALNLKRVAAIDENRRFVPEDNRQTGRAREAGQPAQPFVMRRHIFAQMRIGARDDETAQTAPRQFRAQRAQPRLRGGAFGEAAIGFAADPGFQRL